MIVDLSELRSQAVLHSDICIIGSGAAGFTIAREFAGSRHSVILLESGGRAFEDSSQELCRSEVIGLPHGGIHNGRARQVGGTTALWAGQALPLFEIDFERREWIQHSGWPIDRSTLLPFYTRAEEVMQIPHVTYDQDSWPNGQAPPPAYDSNRVVPKFSQFTAVPNFSDKYFSLLAAAANIRLITHASVLTLEAGPNADVVREARVAGIDGKTVGVRSRAFVVCCGGIESARLLLLSDSVEPNGIGNRYDVVGRYFQDHPGVSLRVKPRDPKRFGVWYDSFRRQGIRYAVKIVASERLQRDRRTLHTGAEVYYPTVPGSSLEAAKRLLSVLPQPSRYGELPDAIGAIARDPFRVIGAAYRHYVLRQPASIGSTEPHLGLGSEQAPNPDSRIKLGHTLDRFGMRRGVLDWRLTGLETHSIATLLEAIAAEWNRLEIATCDLGNFALEGREHGAHGGYSDAFHHMGTTRMGTERRSSVVGADCRVHGYDNLYVGSASVFPTGGFSNPTLTVIALCLRIADAIKLRLPEMAVPVPA